MIFKKNFFLIIIFFIFGPTKLWSSEKIAFLDVELIINKSEPALIIIKRIEKIRDQETKKLKEIEDNKSLQKSDVNKKIFKSGLKYVQLDFVPAIRSIDYENESFESPKKRNKINLSYNSTQRFRIISTSV